MQISFCNVGANCIVNAAEIIEAEALVYDHWTRRAEEGRFG
jgi:hypothetical protein